MVFQRRVPDKRTVQYAGKINQPGQLEKSNANAGRHIFSSLPISYIDDLRY